MTQRITRREFVLAGTSAFGSLCIPIPVHAASEKNVQVLLAGWIRIDANGTVTLLVNSTEMGQGASSALAQILADELELEWSQVRIEMAPVEKAYYGMWATYQTGGSGSIRGMFDPLRKAGALARAKLTMAAAQLWDVAFGECTARSGSVMGPAGQHATYGALASRAAQIADPSDVPLKSREHWQLIGKSMRRLDMQSKCTGTAVYGMDTQLPKMRCAALMQCPTLGGKLVSFDAAAAETAVPGVRMLDINGALAAVALDYWRATRALQAAKPAWGEPKDARIESSFIKERLNALLDDEGKVSVPEGHVEAVIRNEHAEGLRTSTRFIEATYEAPLLAHQTMEPMNATALVRDGRAELWVPTQVQSDMREAVATALGIALNAVTINTTELGGGFGRRLKVDYGVQAALVARHFDGPVKLIWSREEDTQHDFYRPAAIARLKAGVDASGNIKALRARIACLDSDEPVGGLVGQAYSIPGVMASYAGWNPGVPIGAWRSVDASQNLFFFESFIDEIAYATQQDPLEMRRKLLGADIRALRVLNAAAQLGDWSRPLPKGRGRGIAFLKGYGSLTAQVVEVSVGEDRTLRVHQIACAVDCGTAVNPDSVRAQFEGGAIFGLSAALCGEITIQDGKVEQANFDSAPVLRINEVPDVKVVILESPNEKIGGIGEPPVPPVAPALANAIYAACGVRVRQLPIIKAGFKTGKRVYA
jgi:isoquinoline 1-oxidoreductase subunit beta